MVVARALAPLVDMQTRVAMAFLGACLPLGCSPPASEAGSRTNAPFARPLLRGDPAPSSGRTASGSSEPEGRPPSRSLAVMTQNMFQGTELGEAIAARDAGSFRAAVTTDLRQVEASRILERATAIAAAIADAEPDLVGLQEAALWRTGALGRPPATTVAYDALQAVLDELQTRGRPYLAIAVATNVDVEAPSTLGIDVRFTDRVAILVRSRRDPELEMSNPQTGNYDARPTVPTFLGPLPIPDGWASIDARWRSRAFRFVTTHLSGIAKFVRSVQRDELLARLAQTRTPVILAGDFNVDAESAGAESDSTAGSVLGGGFVDAWATTRSGDPGYTCCQHIPDLSNAASTLSRRIDYIFVRGAIRVDECRLTNHQERDRTPSGLWPSDHAGVLATVHLVRE